MCCTATATWSAAFSCRISAIADARRARPKSARRTAAARSDCCRPANCGQYVDRWFGSSRIGARKPDPRAYRAVLDHPGLAAARTVLVDDRPTNLVAAAAAGFRPWLFRSEDTSARPVDGLDVPVARDMAELLTQGRRGWCGG
ncbi:HAD-IA family hydrolase [Kribbella swartbergensis]